MAKFQYSPKIADIWKGVEPLLEEDGPLEPHVKQALDLVIARLEERDAQLESAILGDLVVNDVAGTIGAVAPAQAKQIGWSANFGFFSGLLVDSGLGDGTQDALVTYDNPFLTDTTVLLMTPILVPGTSSFVFYLRTSDKASFTVTSYTGTVGMAAPDTPIKLCYLAVGF